MNGIKFWCYHAGHVLGAAMFMIEIAGVKVDPIEFESKNLFFICQLDFIHGRFFTARRPAFNGCGSAEFSAGCLGYCKRHDLFLRN